MVNTDHEQLHVLQPNAVGITEWPRTAMHVHSTHREMVLIALLKLGQSTSHGQGQGLHISHLVNTSPIQAQGADGQTNLLPKCGYGRGGGFLISEQLIIHDLRDVAINAHIPREHNACKQS